MTLEEEIREEQDRNAGLASRIERFKALLPLNPSEYHPEAKRELEQLSEQKEESDRRLAALKHRQPGNTPKLIVWLGSKRDWGQMILNAYHDGFIQASGPLDTLEQAAEHFIWKDADKPDKPTELFKPRSVWQSSDTKFIPETRNHPSCQAGQPQEVSRRREDPAS